MKRTAGILVTVLLVLSLVLVIPARAADRGAWAPNVAYAVGDTVTYNGSTYQCIQAHTSLTGWEPPNVPALWKLVTGGATNTPTRTPTRTNTQTGPTPTPTRTATRTNTPVGPTATFTRTNTPSGPTLTPTFTSTSGGTTCAVKSAPSGKVLQGYWEAWDGSSVHPGMGHIPLSQVPAGYNVINLAFPVILSDGTAEWFDGMDVGVDVPTPAEVCAAKAAGHWVLLSIGGAAAGIDLSSSTVADKFVATIVPILKANNFDGIDIDIETGLVAGANYNTLSTSQANLIRIIDGVLAQMPSNFMLTMAPETAYVTGGQIAYGGPWGAYLPIIGKYRDNGRLSWLNMQYYNGSMYGCPATSYSAGTVQGFVEQTKCLNNGFTIAGGGTFSLPYSKQVPGLPAQPGAGGGYMVPADVASAYSQVSGIKGLMDWSINWDGSKGWTFLNTRPY
ncbi:MAG TPA: carbohydrate-binding protein [Anaerolineales bacterium]|nr:carbohydrate-binding protein [Anaerolineales bacterium]